MSSPPKRAFIIGLDAATPELIERFAAEGRLPNITKLKQRGCSANPFPMLPTHTPVNWTTISTGARPGTHGITGFCIMERGRSLEEIDSVFDTRNVTAEFLWNTAARDGRRSLLLKWAGPTFPVSVQDGVQVDGCFCVECIHELTGPKRYSTADEPDTTRIALQPAEGWANAPASQLPPLETQLDVGSDESSITLNVLCVATKSDYDTVIVSPSKDAATATGLAGGGEWMSWMTLPFPGKEEPLDASFRFKVVELAPDGSKLDLFRSEVMPTTGWTEPQGVAKELVDNVGPFLLRPGYNQRGHVYGAWAGYDTLLEEIDYQHNWYAEAMGYLCRTQDFDLIFLQSHAPDYIQDALLRDAEPLTAPSAEESARNMELVARTYESCDRMVGRIVDEVATPDDLIAIVSDHGCIGTHSDEHATGIVANILEENGWLVYQEASSRADEPGSKPRRGKNELDWSRTKAILHDGIYIYMNVKGREPHGVVEPEDYEKTRGEIMDALRAYRDPRLGRCPFSMILRSEEAAMLGLYGDRVGDIVFTVEEGGLYGEGHGSFPPTSKYGASSLQTVLILAGPGVREGATIDRPTWLTDIAPTVAYLMGIPPAETMQGAVLYDALKRTERKT